MVIELNDYVQFKDADLKLADRRGTNRELFYLTVEPAETLVRFIYASYAGHGVVRTQIPGENLPVSTVLADFPDAILIHMAPTF